MYKFLVWLAVITGITSTLMVCFVCYTFWPDNDSSLPAWIQAVGSVVAILASVGIMEFQLRRQERNAEKQTHDEQANLVLAALLYAKEAAELFKIVKETIGSGDKMPAALLTFSSQRIAATSNNIDALPIWKMAPSDALELARIQTGCKNVAAAFRTATEAELLSPTPQQPGASMRLVAAQGISNGAKISEGDTNTAIRFLRVRYREMTGVDAPGFPAVP